MDRLQVAFQVTRGVTVGAPLLTAQVRKRLVALIAEDRPIAERLLTRLREFRTLEGVPACSAVVYLLARLTFREDEAEQLLGDLLEHRDEIGRRLKRDPGLRVAAMDYLSNVRPLLRNPAVVEQSAQRPTERSAITDDLTELYNRRHAGNALDIEIRRSRRSKQPLSVLTLDLDSFKSVNNLYGHPFGDLVLKMVGRVLRRSVRHCDVAARVGGEEFVVILPETDRLSAYAAAERIRTSIERHFEENTIGERAVSMTVSGGIASYPRDGEEAEALLARADQALYQSKVRGRNKITIYHSERRLDVRYPVRPRTRLTLSEAGGMAAAEARLLNLSCGGALVEPGHDAVLAEGVKFVLAPESGSEDVQPLVATGRVVRVQGNDPGRPRRLAIAFEQPISRDNLARNVLLSQAARAPEGSA